MRLLILLGILLCPTLLPRHLNQITCEAIVSDPLNVFNVEGEIIMQLDKGTHVDVTGRVGEDFVRVQENGTVGYAHYTSGLIMPPWCYVQLPFVSGVVLPPIDPELYNFTPDE